MHAVHTIGNSKGGGGGLDHAPPFVTAENYVLKSLGGKLQYRLALLA